MILKQRWSVPDEVQTLVELPCFCSRRSWRICCRHVQRFLSSQLMRRKLICRTLTTVRDRLVVTAVKRITIALTKKVVRKVRGCSAPTNSPRILCKFFWEVLRFPFVGQIQSPPPHSSYSEPNTHTHTLAVYIDIHLHLFPVIYKYTHSCTDLKEKTSITKGKAK